MDLHAANLLPAIVFIFSRVGCEQSAQLVLQSKVRLLSSDETAYVVQAITQFAKNNPEIPITRAMVQMLKSGIAVHHAGLIPVWKAFVENLFNANKIKVLFATETLAAGVNMPGMYVCMYATETERQYYPLTIRLRKLSILQLFIFIITGCSS